MVWLDCRGHCRILRVHARGRGGGLHQGTAHGAILIMKPLSFFEKLALGIGAVGLYIAYSVKRVFRWPIISLPKFKRDKKVKVDPKGTGIIDLDRLIYSNCVYAGDRYSVHNPNRICMHPRSSKFWCGDNTKNGIHRCPLDSWFSGFPNKNNILHRFIVFMTFISFVCFVCWIFSILVH
jgi:hypothetical protein